MPARFITLGLFPDGQYPIRLPARIFFNSSGGAAGAFPRNARHSVCGVTEPMTPLSGALHPGVTENGKSGSGKRLKKTEELL